MKEKILCVDDIPTFKIGQFNLQSCLEKIFRDRYEVVIEVDPDRTEQILRNDSSIKLVVLDMDFNGKIRGPEIADSIAGVNEDLPVFILTTYPYNIKGPGAVQKNNVWTYIEKKNLADSGMQTYIRNLADGLLDDRWNSKWILEYNKTSFKFKMVNLETGFKSKEAILPNTDGSRPLLGAILEYMMDDPRSCTEINQETLLVSLTKLKWGVEHKGKFIPNNIPLSTMKSELNKKVRTVTKWRTWGVLDSRGCEGTGNVRLMVGNSTEEDMVEELPTTTLDGALETLYKRIVELEKRVTELEAKS